MKIEDRKFINILLNKLYPYVNKLDNGFLSQVIWSMGHIRHRGHNEILDAVTVRLLDMDKADHLSMRISEVADFIYGFARLNYKNSDLALKRYLLNGMFDLNVIFKLC